MSSFVCPYCYAEHTILNCDLKCSYNVPGMDVNCKFNVVKDADGWIPQVSKGRCSKCTAARKILYCPTVGKEIPSDFLLGGKTLPIALIGAKASGKSNYIGVLVNEIAKKMTASFNCSFSKTCSEESKRYYDDYYYNPLFKSGDVVGATDAGEIPPLLYQLRFMDKRNRITNTVGLTFYDTAGENLDTTEGMEIFNRYIPNAKGIILLLDPLQVPSIRERLQGKIPLPVQNTDANDILDRVVTNIRNSKMIRGNINIPIALAFTKIDALEQSPDLLPEEFALREESAHLSTGAFVLPEFENTNQEMKDILDNWLDEEIYGHLKNFTKFAFFGLTSLGGVPSGNKIAGNKINPRRVLDPLLWILAENGYIKKLKKI